MCDWKAVPDFTGCTYWVFDDFPPERIKSSYKQFMGYQEEFTITDKYMAKKTIHNFGPAIYLMNTPDFMFLQTMVDWDWVKANCVIWDLIGKKLY